MNGRMHAHKHDHTTTHPHAHGHRTSDMQTRSRTLLHQPMEMPFKVNADQTSLSHTLMHSDMHDECRGHTSRSGGGGRALATGGGGDDHPRAYTISAGPGLPGVCK